MWCLIIFGEADEILRPRHIGEFGKIINNDKKIFQMKSNNANNAREEQVHMFRDNEVTCDSYEAKL